MTDIRIGHGYDLHKFIQGKPLILGGVSIEHSHGLEAHSDGDAVIHALSDAILGAAALPDIGNIFPDSEEHNKDMDSSQILQHALNRIKEMQYAVSNADITIIAEQPKIAPYKENICNNLARLMQIEQDRINIKATTEEGLGATANAQALAVHAVVLLQRITH